MSVSCLRKLFWKINDARYLFFQSVKINWNLAKNSLQLVKIHRDYPVTVMSSMETIAYIKEHRCSVSRYGDGELDIAMGQKLKSFQVDTPELTEKLWQVLRERQDGLLICMPRFFNSLSGCKKETRIFWSGWKVKKQAKIVTLLRETVGEDYVYGDTQVTRPYIDYKFPKDAQKIFPALKTLWKGRDILIVEGEQTRLGIGNDLFSGATSIKRMLCPARNAFDYYEDILSAIKAYWNGELILMALGATATVLASDLTKCGIQALDIGHVDIEYEWMKMGAECKCAIPGKYTNEVLNGRQPEDCSDQDYLSQIIWIYKELI